MTRRRHHKPQPIVTAVGAAVAAAALAAAPAALGDGKDPYTKADNTWIDISGTVESVRPDNFTLDYGDGMVIVEMDDGDRDADAYKLMAGDKVTVSGMIDDDFFETTSIEAASVYVENLGTTFFSSAIDEEDLDAISATIVTPVIVSQTIVQGTVTNVDVDNDTFVVDTGVREIRVDVSDMGYDPLDEDGYQMIEVGDRVKVTGKMADDFFEGRQLEADTVIELYYGPATAQAQ